MDEPKRVLFVTPLDIFVYGGGAQSGRAYFDATLDVFGRENVTTLVQSEVVIPPEYEDLKFVKIAKRSLLAKISDYLQGFLNRIAKALYIYIQEHHEDFDICVIYGSLTGGKAVPLIESYGIKTVMVFSNYEVEYRRDNKTMDSLKGHYLGAIRRAEKAAFCNASINMFPTKDDLVTFRNVYGSHKGKDYILGTFDYKARERETIDNCIKKFDIVISGSLVNYQTTIGVKDFYEKFLKITERLIPGVKVLLTGRNPSDEIRQIQSDRPDVFSIISNPENILSVVQEGKIYLCPTCIGGGLKLRAMDGLKCGLPVLSHKVSARGYDYFKDKPYYRVYHDKESFEQGLLDLCTFIHDNPDCAKIINKDYYDYFGYECGLYRFREGLDNL